MKRPLAFIALISGSLALPLFVGGSIAAEPLSASPTLMHALPRPVQNAVRVTASERRQSRTSATNNGSTVNTFNPFVMPAFPTGYSFPPPAFTTNVPSSFASQQRTESARQVAPQRFVPAPSTVSPVPPAPVYRPVAQVLPARSLTSDVPPPAAPVTTIKQDQLKAVDQATMEDRHRRMAKMILGVLPQDCQAKLKSFSVLYDNPKHRGLAGRGVIILSGNVPDKEFIGLLLHEGLGHFADLTCFNGTAQAGRSVFTDGPQVMYNDDPSVSFYAISWADSHGKKPGVSDEDFVTGYAKSDAFEDFGESVAYYFLNNRKMRERGQQNPAIAAKYAWMERHYGRGNLFTEGDGWDGKIPWDATKVVYGLAN